MTERPERDILRRVRKLAQLAVDARQARWGLDVQRLTVLKSLCQDPAVANRFVAYLAQKIFDRQNQGTGRAGHSRRANAARHRQMMTEALAAMKGWNTAPTEGWRGQLRDLFEQIQAEQNEYERIKWGAVRVIRDWNLLLFEYALRGLLDPAGAGSWAYQMARHYAERFDSKHGSGLTPKSAPLLQDIADFWTQEFGLDAEAVSAPDRTRTPRAAKGSSATGSGNMVQFTHRQGQFLAFIHLYHKLHRQGPSEMDMVEYFRVTPPSVHGMVVRLEQSGLIARERGVPRSIRVAIPEEEIPALE